MIVIAGHDHPVAAVGTGAAPGSVVDSLGTGEPVLAAWTGARPTPAEAASLVGRGLTIETWPSTGDPLLIWEGLRPGLAMETLLMASGIPRAELEGSLSEGGHAPASFDRAECMALERGEREPLRRRDLLNAPPSSWRLAWHALLDAYARDAANGAAAVRVATGATGPIILTGGGVRSSLWVNKKLDRSTSRLEVSPVTETGTRGAAALAGVALNWWTDASLMPEEDNE
jgi:sugar (pentulose or hexulose) kinase